MITTYFLVLSIMYAAIFVGAFFRYHVEPKDHESILFIMSGAYLITYAIEALK